METNRRVFSVSEITSYIKIILEGNDSLTECYLRGEISQPKRYSSGSTYFYLKDEESSIKCLMFRRVEENLKFKLEHGMRVLLKGSIEVYSPRGEYKIIVLEVLPEGVGALNLAFMQLKEKLQKEGLFSVEHKRMIPRFPKKIGIITSPDGAVLHDILNILKRRYPLVKVTFVPASVQGKEAAQSIVDAIQMMNYKNDADLIILGRGGGSLEDLFAFNEESVAYAIYNSRIPIISAVGHEGDFTIADFVADVRASTPSAAAEMAVLDKKELKCWLDNLLQRSIIAMKERINREKTLIKQISNRPIFIRPLETIHAYYQKIENLEQILKMRTEARIMIKRKQIEIMDSKIKALNPCAILERGYSIVLLDGKAIKNASDVCVDSNINILLHRGELEADIKKIID